MGKKRKTKKIKAYDSYPIKITSWTSSYSFGLNKLNNFFEGLYSEHLYLQLNGVLLGPEKVASREIEVQLIADRETTRAMTDDKFSEQKPLAIGSLTSRGANTFYLGTIPFDSFPVIQDMLKAGKWKYIILSGEALYYGSARIDYLSFDETFDPEEH